MSAGTSAYSELESKRGSGVAQHYQDVLEIFMMSLALGMDAFSLALGVGLQGIRRKNALQLALCIGWFHIFMTLIGIYVGLKMQGFLGQVAQWFGAFLLLGLGLHMAYSTLFQRDQQVAIGNTLVAMLVFSAGVSIDALSVGFSLGLRSTAYGIVSAGVFGISGAVLCLLGIYLGKRATRLTGMYGELVGAFILMGFGVHFLIP